jgi:hypothetical protein
MKHTKGKVEINKNEQSIYVEANITICEVSQKCSKEEVEANAELIAEAFNVTNESGLTPRQLLDKLKTVELDAYQRGYNEAMSKAKDLINNQFKI